MRSLTQHLKTNIDFVISWQAKYLIEDQTSRHCFSTEKWFRENAREAQGVKKHDRNTRTVENIETGFI